MIELEQAIDILVKNSKKICEVEEKNLLDSIGKISAENIFAKFDNPPFKRSPLDGYALNSVETPNNFKIVGEECAGDFWSKTLQNGETLRIMTGAAIPEGADCVIRQEDIIKLDDENIFVPKKLNHHENFCFNGEDIKKNSLLVEKYQKISAYHIAILASQGISSVKVFCQPKIAIVSTSDELLNLDEKISAGKIFNSNLYLLAARLIEFGFSPKILGILPDDVDFTSKKILEIQNDIDLLITTGGVSVGKKDILHDVIKNIGEKIFWRVKMKPGSPVIGWKTDKFLGISLSGNPFAAFATFELIARPIIAEISYRNDIFYKRSEGILQNNFNKKSHGRRFIRAIFDNGKIFLPDNHQSGNFFSAKNCNSFVDIPANSDELKIGDKVEVILL